MVDEEGQGVANAVVVIHGTGHGGEAVWAKTRSSSDGIARIEGIPAGPWLTLQVRVPGESPTVRADIDIDHGRVRDVGDVRVHQRRVLRVSVLDEAAQPLPGARISLRSVPPSLQAMLSLHSSAEFTAALPPPHQTGETDGGGIATLAGVAVGTWMLEAIEGSRVPAHILVEVPANCDPVLPALVLRIGVGLGGRVVDRSDRPVRGARVVFAQRSGREDALPREVTSDSDGRFHFSVSDTAFPAELIVVVDGRPHSRMSLATPSEDLRFLVASGAPIFVSASDATSDEPIAEAPVSIRIRLAEEMNGKSVWDWDGVTDRAGQVRTLLPPGTVDSLIVNPSGYLVGRAPSAPDSPDYETIEGPAVIEEAVPVSVVARMHRRGPSNLEGIARDPEGQPVAGIFVTDSAGYGGAWPPADAVLTDDRGVFHVDRVDAEVHKPMWLVAVGPGWVDRNPWTTVQPGVGPMVRATVEVVPSATIRGQVLDQNRRPVPGARVTWGDHLVHGGPGPEGRTDVDGRFVLTDLHSTDRWGNPGHAQVTVRAHGFRPTHPPDFESPAGKTVDLGAIILERGTPVAGIVVDASGSPAGGVRLVLCPRVWMSPGPPPDSVHFTMSDAQGRFEFLGVPSPNFSSLLASPRREDECGAHLDLGGDPRLWAAITLRLDSGSVCAGVVVDEEDHPVVGAEVVIAAGQAEWSAWSSTTHTDSQGRFRLTHVPSGPAVVGAFVGSRFMSDRTGTRGAETQTDAPNRGLVRLKIGPLTAADLERMPTRLHRESFPRTDALTPPEHTVW